MFSVAVPLLATTLTRQPLQIAGVTFAGRVPWLMLALPAGAIADRTDRRRLMMAADIVRAAVLMIVIILVATHRMDMAFLYCLVLALGMCDPFFTAANQATLPDLVGDDLLARANGLLYVGGSAAEQSLGPALGGALFSFAHAVPFVGDAASFAASGLLLSGLPHTNQEVPVTAKPRLWADIRSGFDWYRQSRPLCALTGVVAVLALSQGMVTGILVLFALERLHLGGTGYGAFIAVSALGNVAGGLIADRMVRRLGTATVLVVGSALAGVSYLVTSAMASPFAAAALLSLEAVAVVLGNVAAISFRQGVTPPHLQGRVTTIWRTVIWGAIPLGALAGGGIAAVAGVRAPLAVAGGIQLLLAPVAARSLRRALAPGPDTAGTP